jgi:hypothetical protein
MFTRWAKNSRNDDTFPFSKSFFKKEKKKFWIQELWSGCLIRTPPLQLCTRR